MKDLVVLLLNPLLPCGLLGFGLAWLSLWTVSSYDDEASPKRWMVVMASVCVGLLAAFLFPLGILGVAMVGVLMFPAALSQRCSGVYAVCATLMFGVTAFVGVQLMSLLPLNV